MLSLEVEEITVVATSPLPGSGADRDTMPSNVRSLGATEAQRLDPLHVADLLADRIGSAHTNDAQNNPYQPDLQYRGFTASPLLGTPQGLAVYQSGVRVNEPFGDTVNWDLIPDFAVDSVDVIAGSHPMFGLNALGGAVALHMKDGFSAPGTRLEMEGGSFERRQLTLQAGRSWENIGFYGGARVAAEDGWREHSPSRLTQLYADTTWRRGASELGISVTAADNSLVGNGVAPVELLAADRNAVFTHPDRTENRFASLAIRGETELTRALAWSGTTYFGRLDRRTVNGDLIDAEACEDTSDRLCIGEEGPTALDQFGEAIAIDRITSAPGVFNRSRTRGWSFGAATQLSLEHRIWRRDNTISAGVTFDGGDNGFESSAELGNLTPDRTVTGLGLILHAGNEVRPVDIETANRAYGVFVRDVFAVTEALALTLAGRWNHVTVDLDDYLGDTLTDRSRFRRFDLAAGATYAWRPYLTFFGGYSEASRSPSAAELGCADPDAPCRLPNAFVSDPPLDEVIARTGELGGRGKLRLGAARLAWSVACYRTDLDDDILFVASPGFGRGYFRNAGRTRRQGIELDGSGRWQARSWLAVDWFASYALIDATFRSGFRVASPNNPATENGQIEVKRGDTIPSIPRHQLKLGIATTLISRLTLGTNLTGSSGQYLRGDEANLTAKTPSYWLLDVVARAALTEWFDLFLKVANSLDERYASFGTFAETAEIDLREAPAATDPRAYGPGPPVAFTAGVDMHW
ncbi:MAG TPA: TonB-dependent receptor [Terriglobales bacterium]|nr:TonB-dependent receptor [Terriglobales bacterium]